MVFILICIYLFCSIIRPQDWVMAVYGMNLIQITSLSTLFFVVFSRLLNGKNLTETVPQFKFMVLFFGCILMSHITHTYFIGLSVSFSKFMPNFIFFFLMLNACYGKKSFGLIFFYFIALSFSLVFHGHQQSIYGYGWGGAEIMMQHGRVPRIRWIGIFEDPNDLALLFVTMLGFLLPYIFGKINFFIWLASSAMGGGFVYAIILTNSRGGLLSLMATITFFFLKRTGKLFIGSILSGIAVFVIMAIGPSRLGMMSASEGSANTRLQIWYFGLDMLLHNPFFGVGAGLFTDNISHTAHNTFILAAAETGFFGLFCLVGLFYTSYIGLNKVQKSTPKMRNLALGVQSSLIGFAIAGYFLSRLYIFLPYVLFGLSGSVMAIAKNQFNNELDFTMTPKDWKNIFFISGAILIVTYILIKVGGA